MRTTPVIDPGTPWILGLSTLIAAGRPLRPVAASADDGDSPVEEIRAYRAYWLMLTLW